MITYKDLKQHINHMTEEELQQNVTVVCVSSTEVIPVIDHVLGWESKPINEYTEHDMANCVDIVDGVLDEGHPYFTIDF